MEPASDVIDLREAVAVVRRGWRRIVAAALAGVVIAGAVTVLMARTYEGQATVLLKPSESGGPFALPGLGELGGLAGVFGAGASSGFDTEVLILTSRSVLGEVVDSLALQAEVVEPAGEPALAIVSAATAPPDLSPTTISGRRAGDGYRLSDGDGTVEAVPGGAVRLPSGVQLRLATGELPQSFELRVVPRAAAIDDLRDALVVEEPGGQVARLIYEAGDPRTAAAVPNAVVDRYLSRRVGEDRGVNQRRYEFLVEKTDSVAAELASAEAALRQFQETSGVLDPELSGRVDLERAMELESEAETLGIEARTLRQILAASADGDIPVRSLAAYPTFLRNAAINSLLEQLLTVETERTTLGQRRTEQDPEIIALTETIDQLERQLASLSTSYLGAVERQLAAVSAELQQHRAQLGSLPRSAEESYRRQRDVRLLSEMLAALQGQQLQARLGTIAEGGEVRLIDRAAPPLAPSSPNPPLNLAIGLFAGLLAGLLWSVGRGYLGDQVEHEMDASLATGLPVVTLDEAAPVFLVSGDHTRGILVLPVGDAPSHPAVAQRIAATASLRGTRVALAQWSGGERQALPRTADARGPAAARDSTPGVALVEGPRPDAGPSEAREAMAGLESRYDLVVAAVPPVETSTTTALLSAERAVVLVAASRRTTRGDLRRATDLLRRLGIPILAVALTHERRNGR